MNAASLRRGIRIALPACAFLPIITIALRLMGVIGNNIAFKCAVAILVPAAGVGMVVESYWGRTIGMLLTAAGALLWSVFLAGALHRFAVVFTAEDFEWPDFWGGAVLGFFPGLLLGWRIWISCYKGINLIPCLIFGGLVAGFALGTYMGSCWSREK